MVDNSVWRDKDIRIARQSAIKDSVTLLDIAERLGLLKDINDLDSFYRICNNLADTIYGKIYEGME
jgi:hypothetical protein